jgi:hypothetical protein
VGRQFLLAVRHIVLEGKELDERGTVPAHMKMSRSGHLLVSNSESVFPFVQSDLGRGAAFVTQNGLPVDLETAPIIAGNIETIAPRSRHEEKTVHLERNVAAAADESVEGPPAGKLERIDEDDLLRSRAVPGDSVHLRRPRRGSGVSRVPTMNGPIDQAEKKRKRYLLCP